MEHYVLLNSSCVPILNQTLLSYAPHNLVWVFSGSIRSLHCPIHVHCTRWEWRECGERRICDCSQQRRSWLVLDSSKWWAGRFCSQWLCISSTCHTRYDIVIWEIQTLRVPAIKNWHFVPWYTVQPS